MPASRLAEITGLTTGAISGLVDRLESAGFVRRQRDPDDRRRVIIEVVPAAAVEVPVLFEPMLADMRKLHSAYSDEQLAAMVKCLQDAAEVLRSHALRVRAQTADRHKRAKPEA